MKNPKFYTKQNWLTPYALACGYIEISDVNNIRTTLYRDGGCQITHVRQHDFNNNQRVHWETFETLTEARKFYRKLTKGANCAKS